ncbi:hypothetical protein [Salinigranum halophilum]|uniref:hypothetical protein n=1 Tax=Salinigranum halophilum TaxID=2565931 RepID=UPI00191BDC8F|nr:hypothetical protein [Salinigranum halophilum]
MSGVLQTEFEFTLPQGYAADDGELHRDGVMRLATAADEIKPATDPRVESNPSYMTVIILSRVVTELGTVDDVTPRVIENLFVSDLAYLQDLYERVNERGLDAVDAVCPECGESFTVEVSSDSTPGGGEGNGHASGATGPSPEMEVEPPEGASPPEDR